MVSIMVCAAGDSLPVGSAPPSTATTEYVALAASRSKTVFRGLNGNDEPNRTTEERTSRDEADVLSFMMTDDKAQGQGLRSFIAQLCRLKIGNVRKETHQV